MSNNAFIKMEKQVFDLYYAWPVLHILDNGQTIVHAQVTNTINDQEQHVTKKMLANLMAEEITSSLRIVKVNMRIQDGVYCPWELKQDYLDEVLFHFDDAVPLWTQSSIKSGTLYLLPKAIFAKLISRFPTVEQFTSYIGLIFSEVEEWAEATAHYENAQHGEDGNSVASRRFWGKGSCQFRGMALDDEGYPILVAKGVMTGVSRTPSRADVVLNETQVKWSSAQPGTVIIAKTNVDDKPVLYPATFELLQLFEDVPEVHQVLKAYCQVQTRKVVNLLKKGNEVDLLKRLGQLRVKDGELLPADRNVLSALRANLPWCRELEERLGRVFVRELTERIAPSAGLTGWGYLMIQHDELGVRECARQDATCFAFRLPLTSMDNVCWFDRNPKGLVHPDAAAKMEGDSDGDRMVVISDPAIVELFRAHHVTLSADHKPEKTRKATPVNGCAADRVRAAAIQGFDDAPLVGMLTMLQHQLLVAGEMDEAAYVGWLAQMAPMLQKWDIKIDNRPARQVMRETIKDHEMDIPAWKVKQGEAKALRSPRELPGLSIEAPNSIVARAWCWMTETVREWAARNPQESLPLPRIGRLAFKSNHLGKRLPGSSLRWRRDIVARWGSYWSKNYGRDDIDHGPLYQEMEDAGKDATIEQLVALLLWKPRKGDGFMLKWHVLGTRWEEVLGYRPSVAAYVMDKIAGDSPFLQMLVAKLVDTILI